MLRDDLADRVERIRLGLRDDDLVSFDAALAQALNSSIGQAGDLRPLDRVLDAWARVALIRRAAGPSWAEVEERLRRGDEPTWKSEPPYRVVQTPEFSSLAAGLSDQSRVALAELSGLLAREPLPTEDSGLAIEPFGALPNTYSVPFGGGLLVYVVPPRSKRVGLVLVYEPLAVWGWGYGGTGALGNGAGTTHALPVQALAVTTGRNVAAGDYHSLYVDDLTSRVWAWGSNIWGSLGDGTTTTRYSPVELTGLSNVGRVRANFLHSMAVRYDGTVWEWGEVPTSLSPPTLMPTQVPGLADVQDIAAGWAHSVVLKSDGTVWAWGINPNGQVGDGTTTSRFSPVQVSGLADVIAITAGGTQSMALRTDGTVWAWGENSSGELGDGTTIDRSSPVQVGGLPTAATAIAIDSHGLAALADGSVWTWGRNSRGQLGDGMTYPSRPTAAPVSGLSGVVGVAAAGTYSLARTDTGRVWAWGGNDYGNLGDGTTTDRYSPVPIANLTRVRGIAAGSAHALALVAP
jgi:alpha-tubulin suppressor-like RCC1 family protein